MLRLADGSASDGEVPGPNSSSLSGLIEDKDIRQCASHNEVKRVQNVSSSLTEQARQIIGVRRFSRPQLFFFKETTAVVDFVSELHKCHCSARSEVKYPAVSAAPQNHRKCLVWICGLSNRFAFCSLHRKVSCDDHLFLFGLAVGAGSIYPIAEDTTEVCLDLRIFQEGT